MNICCSPPDHRGTMVLNMAMHAGTCSRGPWMVSCSLQTGERPPGSKIRHKGLNPSPLGTRSGANFVFFFLRGFLKPYNNLWFQGYGLGYASGKWASGHWAGQWEMAFFAGRMTPFKRPVCVERIVMSHLMHTTYVTTRYHVSGGKCTSKGRLSCNIMIFLSHYRLQLKMHSKSTFCCRFQSFNLLFWLF